MAITVTKVNDGFDAWGREYVRTFDFHAASGDTYPSGGVVIKAQDVGLKFLRGVVMAGGDVNLGTDFPVVDLGTYPWGLPSQFALRFFSAEGTEISSTFPRDLNLRLLVYGG